MDYASAGKKIDGQPAALSFNSALTNPYDRRMCIYKQKRAGIHIAHRGTAVQLYQPR